MIDNGENYSDDGHDPPVGRDEVISLRRVRKQIAEYYKGLQRYTPESLNTMSPDELYRSYLELDDIVHQGIDDNLGDRIISDPDVYIALTLIRSYYVRFIRIFEAHLAKRLIVTDDPWSMLESYPLYPRYLELVENQGEASDIAGHRLPVLIGCGSVPISQILYKRLYGVGSVGLDIDSEAVSLARRCIRSLNLERDISIVHGDESRLVELPWDLITVAALAEPKSRIFQNLYALMKKRGAAPLCYRTYTGIRAVLYHPVQPDDIRGFRISKEIAPRGRVNNTLVFLEMQ